jgi:hypothetical protein
MNERMSRRKFLAGSAGAAGALILSSAYYWSSLPAPPAGATPTLPSDTTVGTPANRMICWGGDEWLYQSAATYATWAGNGWGGFEITEGSMYPYGGLYNFQNSSAAGLGSPFSEQQVMEADAGSSGTGTTTASSAGFESYLGFYITAQAGLGDTPSDSDFYWPPFGSWWDNALWTNVATTLGNMAAAASYLGMTGMAFDTEQACWTWAANQFQKVSVSGSGSYTLSVGGSTTSTIASGASAATVAAALVSATGNNVVVTGSAGGPYSIEFPDWESSFGAITAPTQSGVTVTVTEYVQSDVTGQAYTYGQNVAEQMWTSFPGLVLLWYHYFPPGGWNDKFYQVVDGSPYPHAYYPQDAFFAGMLAGMHAVGATGRICLVDATFYRDAGVNVSGANNQAAYFLNSQASRACLSSSYLSQSVWNYACDHFDIAGFTWRGAGPGYESTEPTDAQWAQSVMDARAYSEGPRRAEYVWNSAWPAAPSIPDGTPSFTYTSPTMLGSGQPTGAIPASSPSPLSTSVPTITNLFASLVGGVVTITCNAAHAYGIRCVKVYNGTGFNPANPAASYLGAMHMTFEANGGSYTTNYDSAYQACTFYWSGTNGQWYVLEAISIKDDTHWAVVQAPGSTLGVTPGAANVAVGAVGPLTYH